MSEIARIVPDNGPQVPNHLSAASKSFYAWAVNEYVLGKHHEKLLELACVAWDRADAARRLIAKDGAFVRDRYGAIKPSPALRVELDARDAFAKLVKQIDLEGDPDPSKRRR